MMFMQGTKKERPLTHDLLANFLRALGAKIERVIVNDMKLEIHVQPAPPRTCCSSSILTGLACKRLIKRRSKAATGRGQFGTQGAA
jgi:hypothetical protein